MQFRAFFRYLPILFLDLSKARAQEFDLSFLKKTFLYDEVTSSCCLYISPRRSFCSTKGPLADMKSFEGAKILGRDDRQGFFAWEEGVTKKKGPQKIEVSWLITNRIKSGETWAGQAYSCRTGQAKPATLLLGSKGSRKTIMKASLHGDEPHLFFDRQGRLFGITQSGEPDIKVYLSEELQSIIRELAKGGSAVYPYLGLVLEDTLEGLRIVNLVEESPAKKANVDLSSIVLEVRSKRGGALQRPSRSSFSQFFDQHAPGDRLVFFLKSGPFRKTSVEMSIEARPPETKLPKDFSIY